MQVCKCYINTSFAGSNIYCWQRLYYCGNECSKYVYDDDIFLTHFFPVLPFDTTEKNKRPIVFHLESERNSGKKRVKLVTKTLFNI